MESDAEDSLSAHNASWTGARQANPHPLKSNPEFSKGKSPVFSHLSDEARLGEEAAEIIRRAEDLARKKDLLSLISSYPLPDSALYHEDFRYQISCLRDMIEHIRRLQSLVTFINDGKPLHDYDLDAKKWKRKDILNEFCQCMEKREHNLVHEFELHELHERFNNVFCDELKSMETMEGYLQEGERVLPKVDFDLVVPRAYFVTSHNRHMGEVGPMHETSAACEAPDEMLTLAINSAIRQVSAYVNKKRSGTKIRISGSRGEEVATAVMDVERMRQDCSNVVLHISVCGHDGKEEVRQKIVEQVHIQNDRTFSFVRRGNDYISFLDLFELLPLEFFLFVECVDGQVDLHGLELPDWGIIVLTTRSQEVYKFMDVDLEVRMEDHLLPWDLFCENVGQSLVDSSSALQQMAIQLVKECHCQLHAIILLARALKDVTDISVWELALQKLSSHSSTMEEGSSQVMKRVLGVVWDQKDLETKYCIQHCTSRWKEGLVEGSLVSEWISSNIVQTEAEGKRIVEDLISSFLLVKDNC